ncbi:MAG: hypothetical protein U9Q92_04145 [archaeon]|nr:hypothetical protein [archaeon]
MLIYNILLGFDYPLESKRGYDYNLVKRYLENFTKGERELVLSRI